MRAGTTWKLTFEGSANASFFNRVSPVFGNNVGVPLADRVDAQQGGTNISAQYAEGNPAGAPTSARTDGVITKFTGTWTPTVNTLFYATYSEGFRPGLLNRPGGAAGPGGYTVPFALDTDDVSNYEFGWKTELFDRQLRFNGSAFYVEVERLQTTIFDPSIVNLFFSDNAADAEIRGVEGDVTWAPSSVPGLTVAGAFSFLDTEITRVITPTDDVTAGAELAFAPNVQGNLRARYEWNTNNGWTAHVMPQIIYSDRSRSDVIDINSADLDSYTVLSFSTGIAADQWRVELFADNITKRTRRVEQQLRVRS